ncbi:MAG: transposase [Chlorobium sp.]|nr:MAG: transposase [Chlorobium sp.]
MRYRRANIEGGTYFFTVTLADRTQSLLIEHIDLLRSSFLSVKEHHPFTIDAIVIMPEHLHTIWTLPEGDKDFPTRWTLIKAAFSRTLPKTEVISESRLNKGERGIWQRRYWEHLIQNDDDFARHVDYIHFNPVKHGYATTPIDWPNSSIHRFVSQGIIENNWGASFIDNGGDFGD